MASFHRLLAGSADSIERRKPIPTPGSYATATALRFHRCNTITTRTTLEKEGYDNNLKLASKKKPRPQLEHESLPKTILFSKQTSQ